MYLAFGESVAVLLTVLLYVGFVALIGLWGSKISGYKQPYRHYGLEFSPRSFNEFLQGWGLGCVTLLLFYGLQLSLGWLSSQAIDLPLGNGTLPQRLLPAIGVHFVDWQGAIAPGLLTSFGVGLAEEILFRGWLLSELDRDYAPRQALISASLVFAVLHFIKPLAVILATWSQFAGLVTMAIVLVLARRRCGNRLGMAIGLHGGLIWGYYIVNTTHWFKPTGTVPEWVTGISGNPIAGVVGIAFLWAIAYALKKLPQKLL
ncbi:CPBP family intramembrane metalloprotease [Pseudanabaena sp. FACHB-1277]|uniref:CPBP family intramembrane metalloprotease n=2 Tax=Pseudanabaena TaxID=1152 RepID=A0A926USA5_9CYAN|nr:CPBP family intramembrane metalloprotease [Pseudanabaena cinerea FACHB-1277]